MRFVAPMLACSTLLATAAASEPTSAAKEQARQLLKEGNELHDQGEVRAAPAMRAGASGIYVAQGAEGYRLCMMNKRQLNSYRDAFLFAVYRELGAPATIEDPWFTGYETDRRAMTLVRSGVEIECAEAGFVLRGPNAPDESAAFAWVCTTHGVGADKILRIPQVQRDASLADTADRVTLGGALVRELLEAGL